MELWRRGPGTQRCLAARPRSADENQFTALLLRYVVMPVAPQADSLVTVQLLLGLEVAGTLTLTHNPDIHPHGIARINVRDPKAFRRFARPLKIILNLARSRMGADGPK